MKFSTVLLPAFLAAGALAEKQFYRHAAGNPFAKRTTCGRGTTCADACNPGATECGPSGSMCYTPSLGETCCGASGDYCRKGTYCSPEASYCCNDGESLADCATRFNIIFSVSTLPATSAPPASSSVAATSSVEITSAPASSSAVHVPSTASLAPTSSLSNVTFSTATLPPQFTGAAVKKDGAIGAFFLGALGLLAAAV